MVFPESSLKLTHATGVVVEYLALDALQQVNPSQDPLKVAMAEEWSRQRLGGKGEGRSDEKYTARY